MKHLIIAAIVCFGLIVRPSGVAIDRPLDNGSVITTAGSVAEGGAQQLSNQEMRTTVGGDNLTGCWTYVDESGDVHGVCCVDLWIITICGGVNWSAIERLLDV
jgi:hypothetical protein